MRATERGAVAVVVAILLVILCGFAALSLDVGHMFSVRGELQNGADAAALAGAKRLRGTNVNRELSGAVTDARNYARNHPTDVYDVEPDTIQLGAWIAPGFDCADFDGVPQGDPGPDGSKFCAIEGRSEEHAAKINAVRVVTSRQGASGSAGGGEVGLAFGAVLGNADSAPVRAEAIAACGGPCEEECPEFPMAIREGCLRPGGSEVTCDESGGGSTYFIGLSPAPDDSAGLTSLSNTIDASGREACNILNWEEGTCRPMNTSVPINIQNGNDWTAACGDGCSYRAYTRHTGVNESHGADNVCEVLRRKADADCDGDVDLDADGRPSFRKRMPVIKYADEPWGTCAGGYNGAANIVGWATIAIVSARCETNAKLPPGTVEITRLCDEFTAAHGEYSASTCIAIQVWCYEEVTGTGGCGWYGTSSEVPVLVR